MANHYHKAWESKAAQKLTTLSTTFNSLTLKTVKLGTWGKKNQLISSYERRKEEHVKGTCVSLSVSKGEGATPAYREEAGGGGR